MQLNEDKNTYKQRNNEQEKYAYFASDVGAYS